ncbi:MAG: amidohydrolase [Leptolyngbya sp. PLA2]|nr:amidohydrolase [Leptolyngbya sp.]MCE7972123.1 amidohydrolase [Leptolyngbya sp. PL-A2]MCQ3941506.1 amidohydrolase [cyanobacterium CYA1]MCZ7634530.1 amidohydrolase [Phycisphaerales bacterium]MDL1905726.1 amidohydrolase [Synechococcales cyanobacterium CNB]GIK20495.1 MAG: amidohydrolase [Planctomycetota bacterium]
MMSRLLAAVAVSCVASLADAQPRTVYLNANVHTMDPARPRAEAFVVESGRFVAVGSNADAIAAAGPEAERIDLREMTVLPGLIDAHGHMAGLGALGLGMLDLRLSRSYDEVVAIVAARARTTPPGEWIVGRGWDHESWPDKRLPTHDALSAAVPDHPVWLSRVDGHAGLANDAAMRLARIADDTADPPGGEIVRDAHGRATGILIDNAMPIVRAAITGAGVGTTEELLLKAQELCLAVGLTGVHDAGVGPDEIETYKCLDADGRLKMRIHAMVAAAYAPRYFEEQGIHEGPRLSVRAAKYYIDGAMGSRGAWLLDPYADRPVGPGGDAWHGLAVTQPEAIETAARHAIIHGYQLCTHAIGDRANRAVLDAYERALASSPSPDHRFRIEHAQLLHADDIPRFAALGVIPSMQPTHCTSDMRWVYARVGPERGRGAYAWASLLRTGARIAGGSDFPVESHNPFLGLHAAVTRQTAEGDPPGGWHTEQRMTGEEALRAFTLDAAYAAFWEEITGSIAPGKEADFIVIDRDALTCEPGEIPGTRVLRTVVAGETVFENELRE